MIGSLFSGIGGLELGLEWAGLGPVAWQVEKEVYCLDVLAKHWPEARRFNDVKKVSAECLSRVDVLCGGFPCQDVSSAGKRAGLGGDRSGLWYEFARIAEELEPTWIVVENVASGAKKWVDLVRGDLGRIGYATFPVPLGARDVGAPHRRSRVFLIGRRDGDAARVSDGDGESVRDDEQRVSGRRTDGVSYQGDAEPRHGGEAVADGGRHGSGVLGAGDVDREAWEHDESRNEPHGCDARVAQDFPPFRDDFPGWERYLASGGPEPGILPGAHGLPRGVARRRIAALGNAVLPQDAEVIGWMIRELRGY